MKYLTTAVLLASASLVMIPAAPALADLPVCTKWVEAPGGNSRTCIQENIVVTDSRDVDCTAEKYIQDSNCAQEDDWTSEGSSSDNGGNDSER